jgi:hypothetical protein
VVLSYVAGKQAFPMSATGARAGAKAESPDSSAPRFRLNRPPVVHHERIHYRTTANRNLKDVERLRGMAS